MVRRFREKDAKECSKIISECVDISPDLNERAKENLRSVSKPEALIKRMKKRDYFVYEEGGKILGIGALNGNQIRTMYIRPNFQNKGIGALILERLEKQARKKKIKKLFLYTHPKAVSFYLKHGFEIIRKFKDKGLNVTYMEKKLV